MGKKLELIGKKFGRWTVIGEAEKTYQSYSRWICKCECGSIKSVSGHILNNGNSTSCGCYNKEVLRSHATHGHSRNDRKSPEYVSWTCMKTRCYRSNYHQYKDYGGRGIKVCDRWLGDKGFYNFLEDMGNRPSMKHSLDRFPNNDGDYEPGNCRWATKRQQFEGRRNAILLEYNGQKMMLAEWGRELRVNIASIKHHLKKGKSFKEIVDYFKAKTLI